MNIDAQSRQGVDVLYEKVKSVGGEVFANPAEVDGWMYAFGFSDSDGHKWSVLFMYTDNMPK